MIPLDINTAHFRWDRLEAVTIELAVLVLLSGRKERKRRHNDNMRKTDKTSINILILCLTMDGNWFLLVYKRPQKLYPMPHFRWVPDCDDDQTITSRERLSMVVVGDLWRFVKVRSGLAIKKLWMRSCWPLARRRQHQSTGGEERQGREGARREKYFEAFGRCLRIEMASKTMWHHEKDNGDAKDRQMVGEWSERWRPGLKEQPRMTSLSNMLSSGRRKK